MELFFETFFSSKALGKMIYFVYLEYPVIYISIMVEVLYVLIFASLCDHRWRMVRIKTSSARCGGSHL